MTRRVGNPGLKGHTLDKSIESYILSLEIINQLSIKYRVEAFLFLICNAWELLLKAKIIEDTHDIRKIYYKKEKRQLKRTLSLADCLKKVFTNEKDPIRTNIEYINQLRDASMHLVLSHIPREILGLFQACVLNYHNKLIEWFSISLGDRVSVGMMTIVYDFNPEEFDLTNPVLRKKMGVDTARYLADFQSRVINNYNEIGMSQEFAIDISYKLALTEKPGEADITLTKGISPYIAGVVEVAKDPSKTHPNIRPEAINAINTALGTNIKPYNIESIVNVYKIKSISEFYFKNKVGVSQAQYSQAFIDWVINKYRNNNQFFAQTAAKYSEIIKTPHH